MPFQRPADRENVRMCSADFRLTANESLDFNRNFNRNFLITISLRALDDRLVAETAPYPGIIYLAGSDLDSVRAPAQLAEVTAKIRWSTLTQRGEASRLHV